MKYAVTCRFPNGDINHRSTHAKRESAEHLKALVDKNAHCTLEHVVEEIEEKNA